MAPNMGSLLIYVGLSNGIRILDLNTMTILDDDDVDRSIDTVNVDCMVLLGDSLYTSNGFCGLSSLIRVWDLGVGDLDSDYESLSIIGRPGGRGFSTILVLSDTMICCGGSTGDLWYIDIITNDIHVVETHPSHEITTLLLLSKLHNHALLSCEGHGKMVIWDGVTRREILSISIPILVDDVAPIATDYHKCRAVELDDGRVCFAGRDRLCIWKLVLPAGEMSMEFGD